MQVTCCPFHASKDADGPATGVSKDTDAEGFLTYQRPEGKSGGHGVGWSEIPRYSFKLPEGWEETPVSIADLGGTEVRPALVVPCHIKPCQPVSLAGFALT